MSFNVEQGSDFAVILRGSALALVLGFVLFGALPRIAVHLLSTFDLAIR